MSVEQLHRPVVASWIASARESIEAAGAVPLGVLDRFELGEGVAELAALEAQVAALRLAMLAEADARRVADETGDTGTDAWAARLTGSTRGVMAGGIWLAKALRETYHATREAFATGAINESQVRVIVQAAQKMPEAATEEQREAAEQGLVAKAVAGMNARRLRQAARRMLEAVSEDLADQQEADQLDGEEKRAEVETWLRLSDNDDGTVSGRFVIPELQAPTVEGGVGAALGAAAVVAEQGRGAGGGRDVPGGWVELHRAAGGGVHRASGAPAHRRAWVGGGVGDGARQVRESAGRSRLGPAGHRGAILGRAGPAAGLQRRDHPCGARRRVGAARPGAVETVAHSGAAAGAVGEVRQLRRGGL